MPNPIDFIIHIDKYLGLVIDTFGPLTYVFLFIIIFLETGFVITPFLPGDSLLFAAGTFSATGYLDIKWIFLTLLAAAILGDTVNYWIGRIVGPRVFRENVRFLKKEYLVKTEKFYEKHGGKTIIIARFMPIIRTFAPFVAGIGRMDYTKFLSYNVIGAFVWVSLFTIGGYIFGNIPIVRDNFHTVIIAIVILSILPPLIEYLKHRQKSAEKPSER